MRLLITTDTVGGVWTFTTELTEQLLQRGHSVHLVSFGQWPSGEQHGWLTKSAAAYPNATSGNGTETGRFTFTSTDIPLEWMENNERAFEDGQTMLVRQLEQQPADLILSNQFCFGRLDTSIPRIVAAHSDVFSWARACRPSALEPTPWLNRYTAMVQGGLLDASAVVAPTAWMGRAITASLFLPRSYSIIPNGAGVSFPAGFSEERKLEAVTAGRLWDPAKGLDTLQDLISPIPIRVAGDHTFEFAATESAWPPHLESLGLLKRRDLHKKFTETAIYLCASRYEPFGLAPLEAALCGCAIIARDIPSLREVWADSALYFTDNISLSGILNTLANDPNLLAQAQTRAHQRAQYFTPERMADNYLHLFGSILQQQQATQHVA